ncbi:NADH-quinone oxidoreductase subunit C [uncultured Campylobacter sp.]|uniref:NADH-quinone oxidoreductase subunit C n=1 Tax=uncultured Campylobacter sp. TaxID=218934 RepID=UPI0026039D8B|nr:NADH-quinone oxidoreductase subunit C [uncultured Campylobacter sp.]
MMRGYKDRFYVPLKTKKKEPKDTKFASDYERLKGFVDVGYVEFEQLILKADRELNLTILKEMKELGYTILCDIFGVDEIEQRGGIEVSYQLLDIKRAFRARVVVFVKEKEFLKSVTSLYKSANWAERELYDMMGVWIKDHPNLSRLIMPDDWHGHPLLKSYPLQGDEAAKWYEVDKIFGKEYRAIIGEENRDPSFIDSKDSFNFARLYHDSEYGGEIPEKPSLTEYQEEEGVAFVKKVKRDKFKEIKKRK